MDEKMGEIREVLREIYLGNMISRNMCMSLNTNQGKAKSLHWWKKSEQSVEGYGPLYQGPINENGKSFHKNFQPTNC